MLPSLLLKSFRNRIKTLCPGGGPVSYTHLAKEILAYELTSLVHGEAEAEKAQETARKLFSGGGDAADMPCTKLRREDFDGERIDILPTQFGAGHIGCIAA